MLSFPNLPAYPSDYGNGLYLIGDAMIGLQDFIAAFMFVYNYSQCSDLNSLKTILIESPMLRNTLLILFLNVCTVPAVFCMVYYKFDTTWALYVIVFSYKINLTAYCLERLVKYRVGFSNKTKKVASSNSKSGMDASITSGFRESKC
ncbi:hypothetical protein HDU92_004812 [Lobulomyces angularis]|nr:hypothetical protein HDU92_004812 [Lobulomyces angularis]